MWSTTTVVGSSAKKSQSSRQVRRLEIDDDVPVEFDDAAGDLDQLVFRREVHEPLDEIEPHAAHASFMKPLELIVAHAPPHGRDAARLAAALKAGVNHRAIVGAVACRLDDDVAHKAEMIAKRK